MSTLLFDEPDTASHRPERFSSDIPENIPGNATGVAPSAHVRQTMAAARVSFTWFGVRKTLTAEQKSQAADTFDAAGECISASKKLLDTKHPAFKAVTAVRGKILAYWKLVSLPFPEAGIRLIRQADIQDFNARMEEMRDELAESVRSLDEHYADLRSKACEQLGRLFNSADYPRSLAGLFLVSWDFPSVEPPPYLQQLSPDLYAKECQRVQSRFDEAVQLAEQAFTDELAKLVSHLTERLSGEDDGKPKIFRDSAIENLTEFFSRFRQLNVRSNEQLDGLVSQAQRTVQGIDPQDLRENRNLRQHVATQLAGVQAAIDGMLVDRPRRNILRGPKAN